MSTRKTVVEGDQAMIFDENGRGRLIVGPQMVSID